MVVIGAGVAPDVMLATAAGLELGESGGVRCSSRLETSVPGIYAAGDMCEYDSPMHGGPPAHRALGRGLQPRQDGGAQHARPRPGPRDGAVLLLRPVRLVLAGVRRPGPRVGSRRSCAAPSTTASSRSGTCKEGRVAAALSVGRSDDLEHARRLMTERTDVPRGAGELGDVDVRPGSAVADLPRDVPGVASAAGYPDADPLRGRLTVRRQPLELVIGVRVPAPQLAAARLATPPARPSRGTGCQ